MMKLSKNILILIGSYLGVLMLISCTSAFLSPLSVGTGDNDSAVNGDVGTSGDIPASALPSEEDTDDAALVGSTGEVTQDTVTEDLPPEEDSDGTERENADNDVPSSLYYLRTVKEDGVTTRIGVYDADGNLLETLNTPLYALPAGDRAMLDVGIEVSGEEALDELIEDFGG